ncbi:MAG TPA: acyl carrier protein [Sphingomicrobium sp.]|nr:acyl carrier protein [Sphingomicrobium sp.]
MQRKAQHPEAATAATVEATLRALLAETLGLSAARIAAFTETTPLFGALPEFDSLAVANFLTAFEERFAVLIEDHDVEAEDFDSFGSLLSWTKRMTLH